MSVRDFKLNQKYYVKANLEFQIKRDIIDLIHISKTPED